MDEYSSRENNLLGYISQKSQSKKDEAFKDSDLDFHDVFGGPPRRSSIHDMRHSFSGSTYGRNRQGGGGGEEEGGADLERRTWQAFEEKPVFGEEGGGVARKRYTGDAFFDDIFRGDKLSNSNTPRRFDSLPGSRILSPARPLPPSSTAPSLFSLPAKLNKGTDLPAYASVPHSPSRFSNQAISAQDESRNKVQSSYRQIPLSIEFSLGSDGTVEVNKSDGTNQGENVKRVSNSSESFRNSNHFHFSIYKWASKGVPVMVPLRSKSESRMKEKNTEGINTDIIVSELPEMRSRVGFPSLNGSDQENGKYIRIEIKEQEHESIGKTRSPGTSDADQCQIVEEAELIIPEAAPPEGHKTTVKDSAEDVSSHGTRDDQKTHSLSEMSELTKAKDEKDLKPISKPLHTWIRNNNNEQGGDNKTTETRRKESDSKNSKKLSRFLNANKSFKKQDGKSIVPNVVEVDKAGLQGPTGKNKVKGKVREFVKIFNQETPPKSKIDAETRSRSFKLKIADTSKQVNEVHPSTQRAEDLRARSVEKNEPICINEEGYCEKSEKQDNGISTAIHVSSNTLSEQKDSQSSVSYPDSSKDTLGSVDECHHGDFQVKELSEDHNQLPGSGKINEEFRALDAKIRKWSNGKDTNIRSLLSTLQYVLWPGSGWKPVPLVDIIEGNAVKRAYQRALLCLHPDKLQQKGAAADQKYTAEKVFDILQDAWTHFSSLGSL